MDVTGEALRAAADRVAAAGSDAGRIASLVAWSVRPRRSLDALRRACRDGGPCDDPGRHLAALARSSSPDERLGALKLLDAWAQQGVEVAVVGDPAYPARLAAGYPHLGAPPLLAWRGPAIDATPSVAIVGARRASGYGRAVADWIAEAVASAGVRVVSGGALGIDAAAHESAMDLPGGTAVVLGCGHAVAYPQQHARRGGLFDRILGAGGTLLSECLPFEPPRPGVVRARNRIVAALADVVVVVEGGARSGALLTASAAADWGRTVLAVPGDVRAAGSVAPHRLLGEGAAPCTEPHDVFAALAQADEDLMLDRPRPSRLGTSRQASAGASALSVEVRRVLARAWPRPVALEDLATASGLPVPRLLAEVTRARVAGELAQDRAGIMLARDPGGDGRVADVPPR